MRVRCRNFETSSLSKRSCAVCVIQRKSPSSALRGLPWVSPSFLLSPIPHAVAQESGETPPLGEAAAGSGEPIPLPETVVQRTCEEPPHIIFGRSLVAKLLAIRVWNDAGVHPPGHVSSGGLAFEQRIHRRHRAKKIGTGQPLSRQFRSFTFKQQRFCRLNSPSTGQPIKGDPPMRGLVCGSSISS